MTLIQLQYLVAVSQTGGFTAAALRECVSQPTVTEQIARLESAEFGVGRKLVVRRSRGCELTPAGKALTTYALTILDAVAKGKLAVAQAEQLD